MADYKVFIPTSGVGSRLGEITKYTNKSLIKIGKKPAISYIIENYPEECEIVIGLGYYKEHVKDFLNLAYPNRRFSFFEVDNFDGPNSSLLYSISKAKNLLQCPFIFHACDTIVNKIYFKQITENWLGGFTPSNNSQYRSFNIQKDFVKKINDKGEIKYDLDYVGVFGIKDYEKFWLVTDELLHTSNFFSSDYDIIKNLMKECSFKYIEFKEWFDIGNTAALLNARKNIHDKFDILDKNNESIFIFDNFVIKFFHDEKICLNRVERANILKKTTPKILGSSKNFYKYEFSNGELLSSVATPSKIDSLLEWSKKNLWIQNKNAMNFEKLCENFYFEKTNQRVQQFLVNNNILDQEDTINGLKVPSMSSLLAKIDKNYFCKEKSYNFHGDFILDNILIDEDKFVLLDWRQDFAGDLENGDIYYDLGKLNHNFIFNHELVNNNNYSVKMEENHIFCDILVSKNLLDCKKRLEIFCETNNFDYKKVEILSSIIWINMAPLHIHPLDKFLYYFGKYNLFRNINTD